MTAGQKKLLLFLPVAGAAFLLSFYQVTTYDVFWHLKTGQVILGEGRLLETNLFSAVYADHPWPNPEWLFQVLLALVFALGGWPGVTLFKVSLVLLIAGSLYGFMIRRRGAPLLSASLTVIFLCAMQFRLTERPQLFSFLFLVLTLLVVEDHRRRGGRLVWGLPLLFALWSNIHPELIIGLLFLGAAVTGEFLNSLARGREGMGRLKELALASALCLPATLLNPEGYHVLTFPFLHTFLGPVIEVEEYAFSGLSSTPIFWIILAASALMLLTSRDRDWSEIFLVGGTAILGVLYLRATPYLFIAAAPVLCTRLSALPSGGLPSRRRAGLLSVLAAAAALSWALGFERLMPYRWGWGLDERDLPAAAAGLLESGRFPGTLYNGYSWGGYLLFRLHPNMGVFQDGRVQAYPTEFVARLHSRFSIEDWPKILDDYGVNTALVTRLEAEKLFSPARWGVAYWDDRWVILLRRGEENADLLDEVEYRLFLPDADVTARGVGVRLEDLVEEMERNQGERGETSAVTDNNMGVLLLRLGRGGEAEEAFRRSVAGEYAPAWVNLASLLLRRGGRREAERALERAFAIDPSLGNPAVLLERISPNRSGGGTP
jgi:tetratricopeptide (TPR) repeat protein